MKEELAKIYSDYVNENGDIILKDILNIESEPEVLSRIINKAFFGEYYEENQVSDVEVSRKSLIIYYTYNRIGSKNFSSRKFNFNESPDVVDFLRLKGFLMDWCGLTQEDMTSHGYVQYQGT